MNNAMKAKQAASHAIGRVCRETGCVERSLAIVDTGNAAQSRLAARSELNVLKQIGADK